MTPNIFKMTCPCCHGDGVILHDSVYGGWYGSCLWCDGAGRVNIFARLWWRIMGWI